LQTPSGCTRKPAAEPSSQEPIGPLRDVPLPKEVGRTVAAHRTQLPGRRRPGPCGRDAALWRRPDYGRAMTRRGLDRALGGAAIAGVPLHATQMFLAVALVLGFLAGRDVATTTLLSVPRFRSLHEALHAFELGGLETVTHPSTGWVVVAGLGAALVYGLSVLAHELGHLAAARVVGVEVAAIELHAAGGFVEMNDDDALTAGKLATIAGAGPLVTAGLTLVSGVALTALGWPLTSTPVDTGADAALGRTLTAAFLINALGLATNLLPVRPFDGAHLLVAARLWRLRRG